MFCEWPEVKPRPRQTKKVEEEEDVEGLKSGRMKSGQPGDKGKKCKEEEKEDAILALSNYLQFTSEVRAPRKACGMLDNYHSLSTPSTSSVETHQPSTLSKWFASMRQICLSCVHEHDIRTAEQVNKLKWMLVGTGVGVGTVIAARVVDDVAGEREEEERKTLEEQEGGEEDEDQDDDAMFEAENRKPITACSGYVGASMGLCAKFMLTRNAPSHKKRRLLRWVNLIGRRAESVTCHDTTTYTRQQDDINNNHNNITTEPTTNSTDKDSNSTDNSGNDRGLDPAADKTTDTTSPVVSVPPPSHVDDDFNAALVDTCGRAQVGFIDPLCMDEGLIGKRLLYVIRHVRRQLAIPNAIIFPSKASVFAAFLFADAA
eukprot:GHVS01004870.1.p1 GENE.GHVS01004870.1~~GHVS01004870.1.p1  ORF type:complete len:373 (+),score=77.03 GHVS01004870.1:962-2080(+)